MDSSCILLYTQLVAELVQPFVSVTKFQSHKAKDICPLSDLVQNDLVIKNEYCTSAGPLTVHFCTLHLVFFLCHFLKIQESVKSQYVSNKKIPFLLCAVVQFSIAAPLMYAQSRQTCLSVKKAAMIWIPELLQHERGREGGAGWVGMGWRRVGGVLRRC